MPLTSSWAQEFIRLEADILAPEGHTNKAYSATELIQVVTKVIAVFMI